MLPVVVIVLHGVSLSHRLVLIDHLFLDGLERGRGRRCLHFLAFVGTVAHINGSAVDYLCIASNCTALGFQLIQHLLLPKALTANTF